MSRYRLVLKDLLKLPVQVLGAGYQHLRVRFTAASGEGPNIQAVGCRSFLFSSRSARSDLAPGAVRQSAQLVQTAVGPLNG